MVTPCTTCDGTGEIESCPTHGGSNCPCVHTVETCPDCIDGSVPDLDLIPGLREGVEQAILGSKKLPYAEVADDDSAL